MDIVKTATATRRRFLALSAAGVVVALGLAAKYTHVAMSGADSAIGTGAVIVVLILLNARANLRYYRLANAVG